MKTTINDTRKIYSHKILHTVRFTKMNDAAIQYRQDGLKSEIKSEKKERIGGQKKKGQTLDAISNNKTTRRILETSEARYILSFPSNLSSYFHVMIRQLVQHRKGTFNRKRDKKENTGRRKCK